MEDKKEQNYFFLLELDPERFTYQDIQAQVNAKASQWKRLQKTDAANKETYQRWLGMLPQIREAMKNVDFCKQEAERAKVLVHTATQTDSSEMHIPIYPIVIE